MSRQSILEEVNTERDRQDKVHPSFPKALLTPDWQARRAELKAILKRWRETNNQMEAAGVHTVYGIAYEELLEACTAETYHEVRAEAIQNAAIWVRVAENVGSWGMEP